jgi:glutathione S-transferase
MQQQPPQLQPGALQQASDDGGSLYVPQPNAAFHQHHQHQQQQQQHYALGAPPQPLHFDEHYASFPPAYPQAANPPFALTGALHTPRVPQRPLHHISPSLQPAPPQHDHAPQSYAHVPPPAQPPQASPQDKSPFANHGQFQGLKLIADPPNLDEWRARLFSVDETITLTQDEFQTYFPHIDNVYSHRSTQRHKRRRFVSHYWDCRLKGRPPGTKKSTDPDKKKRKRVARERDLCDVKVKITEFFDQREYEEQMGHPPPPSPIGADATSSIPRAVPDTTMHSEQQSMFFQPTQMLEQQPLVTWDMPQTFSFAPGPTPGRPPKKFYTFQRVNGNGGNGKGDGTAGPHKHSLEESDRVKKNSVVRWLAKFDKERKKSQVSSHSLGLFLSLAVFLLESYPLVPFAALVLCVVAGDRHDITMRRESSPHDSTLPVSLAAYFFSHVSHYKSLAYNL